MVGTASKFSTSWTEQRTFSRRYLGKTNTWRPPERELLQDSGEGQKRVEPQSFTFLVRIWTKGKERPKEVQPSHASWSNSRNNLWPWTLNRCTFLSVWHLLDSSASQSLLFSKEFPRGALLAYWVCQSLLSGIWFCGALMKGLGVSEIQ